MQIKRSFIDVFCCSREVELKNENVTLIMRRSTARDSDMMSLSV
jgi:hypothetical protein